MIVLFDCFYSKFNKVADLGNWGGGGGLEPPEGGEKKKYIIKKTKFYHMKKLVK